MPLSPETTEYLCHLLKQIGDLFAPHDTLDGLLEEAARVALELLEVDHALIVWTTDSPRRTWVRAKWSRSGVNESPVLSDKVVALVERVQYTKGDGPHSQPELLLAHEDEMVIRCLRVKEESVGYLIVIPHLGSPNQLSERLFSIIGDRIGQTIEVHQTRQLLASRYSSLMLSRETNDEKGEIQHLDVHLLTAVRQPEKAARLLARSFYKELRKAGFDTDQVLLVASEIIANLTETIRKTRAKTDRESHSE